MRDYGTSDITVAGYLLLRKHPLLRIEGERGKKTFYFPLEAKADVPDFFNGAEGPLRDYYRMVRDLRGLAVESQ